MVEHLLAKEGVAGSIPVSRFYFLRGIQWIPLLLFCSHDVYRTRAGSMSRLPARSLLLLRRVIHRMTATRLALFFTFLGVFCVCTYIWKILKLKHFPKKNNPIYKIRILTNNSLKVYNCNEYLIK